MLIASGLDATAELYDPIAQTFSSTGGLNTARQSASATLLSNGKVLIAGGLVNGAAGIGTAELYDPATGTFAFTGGSLNTPRGAHTATLLPDGTVLLAGGYNCPGTCTTPILGSAEIYDPSTSIFTNTGSLSTARWQHTATLLNDGTALIAGGFSGSFLSSSELYYSTAPLAPLVLTTPNPQAIAGVPYTQFLLEQGGVGHITWSLQSGPLPTGLTLNSSNGLISGTPTVKGRIR